MKIGEVYGNSNSKLIKSISSSGKSLLIDFKKQYMEEILYPMNIALTTRGKMWPLSIFKLLLLQMTLLTK